MTTRKRRLRTASKFGVPACAALVLAGCTAAEGGQRKPAPPHPVASQANTKLSTKPMVVVDRPIVCPAGLLDARRGGSDPDRYSAPTREERAAMVRVIASLVARGASGRAQAASEAVRFGYRVEDVPEFAGVVLLRELQDKRRGGGAYMLRLGAPSTLVVQAAHTFFDEGTLPLGCELFARASSVALFIDTAHRYKAAPADEQGQHPADVAHSRESLFQSATEGLLQALPHATVVQLHGFGPRESGAAVVLSSGVARRGGVLETRAQQQLAALVSGSVQRFPDETSELGATTNVQGELVRKAGGSFLHVELGAALRQALLANADLRARFLDALARSVIAP